MLKAITRNWYSLDFDVHDPTGACVGTVDLSDWGRDKAKLDVGGARSYRATHKSASPDFVLSGLDGAAVMVARKPSAWKDHFFFEYEGNRYELKPESVWRRNFILTREGLGTVGSLHAGGGFKLEWTAELPEEFTPEVKLFVMWLVRLLWQRTDSAAAGGG